MKIKLVLIIFRKLFFRRIVMNVSPCFPSCIRKHVEVFAMGYLLTPQFFFLMLRIVTKYLSSQFYIYCKVSHVQQSQNPLFHVVCSPECHLRVLAQPTGIRGVRSHERTCKVSSLCKIWQFPFYFYRLTVAFALPCSTS